MAPCQHEEEPDLLPAVPPLPRCEAGQVYAPQHYLARWTGTSLGEDCATERQTGAGVLRESLGQVRAAAGPLNVGQWGVMGSYAHPPARTYLVPAPT